MSTFGLTSQDFNFGIPTLNLPAGFYDTPGLAPTAPPGTSGAGGGTGLMGGPVGLALTGLQTLGNLWGAFQAQKLAKKQFKLTKDVTETNLANQIKSYNTALADRARSRGVMEGQSPDQVSQYISSNALSRDGAKTAGTSLGNISAAALSNYSNYRRPEPENGQG